MAVTRSVMITKYAWESYNIEYGTLINPGVGGASDIVVELNNIYPLLIFEAQASASYTPDDRSTWGTNPIYSGQIYFSKSNSKTDIMEFARDQFMFFPFAQFDDVPNAYKIERSFDSMWEFPLLVPRNEAEDITKTNIYYVYITDTVTGSSLEILLRIIPNMQYNINDPYIESNVELSHPILNIVAPNQILTRTFYGDDAYYINDVNLTFYNKHESSTYNVLNSTATTELLNRLSTVCIRPEGALASTYPDVSIDDCSVFEMTINNKPPYSFPTKQTYVLDPCIKYVLYYINSYGGWDWLVVRGSIIKTYKQKQSSYDDNLYLGNYTNTLFPSTRDRRRGSYTSISNTKLQSNKGYLNDITTDFKINLGWFEDDEITQLYNLFLSSNVYLHDLSSDVIYPLQITSSSLEEKRYAETKTLNKYSINVTLNQNKNIK